MSVRRRRGGFAPAVPRSSRSGSSENADLTRSTRSSRGIAARARRRRNVREQAALLDLTHDTSLRSGRGRRHHYWNRGAEDLYGWTKAGPSAPWRPPMQTVFPAPLDELMAELTRTGRWEGELVHTRRDGTTVVVASRWSLQRSTHGRALAILETNNDITERKRAEEALHQARTELAHVTRVTTLGELAASIAHEINQPLAAIIADANACLHWLDADPAPLDQVREALAAVVNDGNRAAEVLVRIRAMLARSAVAREPCQLAPVIGHVLPLVRPELDRHGIALQMSLAADLPPVLADRIHTGRSSSNARQRGRGSATCYPRGRGSSACRRANDRERPGWSSPAGCRRRVPGAGTSPVRPFLRRSRRAGHGPVNQTVIIEGHGAFWETAHPHGAAFTSRAWSALTAARRDSRGRSLSSDRAGVLVPRTRAAKRRRRLRQRTVSAGGRHQEVCWSPRCRPSDRMSYRHATASDRPPPHDQTGEDGPPRRR